jgi:hypothetical protein
MPAGECPALRTLETHVVPLNHEQVAQSINDARQCQDCLAELERADAELSDAEVAAGIIAMVRPAGVNPWPQLPGRPSPPVAHVPASALSEQDRRRQSAGEWQKRVREAIVRLAEPLMHLAVRPEVGEDPAKLRDLILGWVPGVVKSNPQHLIAAKHFVGNLVLKLENFLAEPRNPNAVQYVTLAQIAALVQMSKRTLENCRRKMPDPDILGGGGKASKWKWHQIRPWLETHFGVSLPTRLPEFGPHDVGGERLPRSWRSFGDES